MAASSIAIMLVPLHTDRMRTQKLRESLGEYLLKDFYQRDLEKIQKILDERFHLMDKRITTIEDELFKKKQKVVTIKDIQNDMDK